MVDLPFSFEGKNRLRTQNLFFSEGTYQAELLQGKDFFWPFLQIDDSGKILDCFCTCSEAEQKGHCVHLETLLKIVGVPPLHVRFHRSLWYELCQIAARRHGYESKVVHKSSNDLYQARSSTGKVLLQITPLTKEAKLKLEEILAHATPETEETSLKFSKLSAEELLLWKQGRPSRQLQFELSFWSDLAKWWMLLQEQKKKYKIRFVTEKGDLPKGISIDFEDLKVVFYIAEVNWNTVIPTLQTVDSPLKVYELPDKRIQAITYDKEKKAFYIQHEALYEKTKPVEEGIRVGDYIYKEGDGFALADPDPILFESTIPEKKIFFVLQRHRNLIEKYLKGDVLHDQAVCTGI